jgi:hypothetical protein
MRLPVEDTVSLKKQIKKQIQAYVLCSVKTASVNKTYFWLKPFLPNAKTTCSTQCQKEGAYNFIQLNSIISQEIFRQLNRINK